ncbi:ABC transporter substrate-binding protein [Spirosoma taeanense]|uniref:ABC transporter substrate-binding protein n=1 Tax=Spirosoma taeanense TaxID=2735870 RepID=A0A6M5Y492_9BACT|nr:helical backbone metal receptor [Spirosoma taeanense]QJW88595.1 ABC transporter substrate-binding protein [Spirosoma taeanense]
MLPQRIVSLVPSQTELLIDLGLDKEIVGITKFCIHPADKVRDRAIVGGTKTLHLDRIRVLEPDLILANKEENTREQIEELQRQFRVHVTDVNTLVDALNMIREVGELTGKREQAEQLVRQLTASFDQLPQPGQNQPAAAYFIWRKPYMVAARATFIDAMLETAGFRNAFADRTRYPEVTPADLQAVRPDLILLSSEPYPFTEKHIAELQSICPSARVLVVDGELFSWYGSRLLRAADYFRNLQGQIARLTS